MPIMAKSNDEYTEVKAIKTPDGTEIDYVLSKVDNTYKRTYTATRELEDTPPLEFKSIKPNANLTDYRIYGQTVDGESVGDRTGNLFDGIFLQGYYAFADGSYVANYPTWICTNKLPCKPNTTYTLSFNSVNSRWYGFLWFTENGDYILSDTAHSPQTQCHYTASSPSNAAYMLIDIAGYPDTEALIKPSDVTDLMLVEGSTPLPYEPYGYKIPVTVEGKNLLQNTATSQTINGVAFTVNSDWSVTCNGTSTAVTFFAIPMTINQGSYIASGCPIGSDFTTPFVTIRLRTASGGNDVPPFPNNDFGRGVTISSNKNNNDDYYYKIRVPANYTCNNLTFYPMIRLATIEDDTYEPYRTPVTTPIYLPEQIKKVGNEAEYIDYGEQKFHRISGADLDVTLPALPTVTGTNVLSVGTEVQPSDMYIKGNFKMIAGGGE